MLLSFLENVTSLGFLIEVLNGKKQLKATGKWSLRTSFSSTDTLDMNECIKASTSIKSIVLPEMCVLESGVQDKIPNSANKSLKNVVLVSLWIFQWMLKSPHIIKGVDVSMKSDRNELNSSLKVGKGTQSLR